MSVNSSVTVVLGGSVIRLPGLGGGHQAALTGHYRLEHAFVLHQNLDLFDAYQRQLAACDAAIEAHVYTLAAKAPPLRPRCQARGRGKSPAAMNRASRFAARFTG